MSPWIKLSTIISGPKALPPILKWGWIVSSAGRLISRIVQPTSVRLVELKRNCIILATAQLPHRRNSPMLAPRQMNMLAVRLP